MRPVFTEHFTSTRAKANDGTKLQTRKKSRKLDYPLAQRRGAPFISKGILTGRRSSVCSVHLPTPIKRRRLLGVSSPSIYLKDSFQSTRDKWFPLRWWCPLSLQPPASQPSVSIAVSVSNNVIPSHALVVPWACARALAGCCIPLVPVLVV